MDVSQPELNPDLSAGTMALLLATRKSDTGGSELRWLEVSDSDKAAVEFGVGCSPASKNLFIFDSKTSIRFDFLGGQ